MAVDAAGWRSDVITSSGVTIDTTPPIALRALRFGVNVLKNPSFELNGKKIDDVTKINFTDLVRLKTIPLHWTVYDESHSAVLKTKESLAPDGRAFLVLYGSIQQSFPTDPGERYRLVFYASHAYPSHNSLLTLEGEVQLPGG